MFQMRLFQRFKQWREDRRILGPYLRDPPRPAIIASYERESSDPYFLIFKSCRNHEMRLDAARVEARAQRQQEAALHFTRRIEQEVKRSPSPSRRLRELLKGEQRLGEERALVNDAMRYFRGGLPASAIGSNREPQWPEASRDIRDEVTRDIEKARRRARNPSRGLLPSPPRLK